MQGCFFFYKIGHFFAKHKMGFVAKFFQLQNRIFYGNAISPRCSIGKGTRFPHGGLGVLLHDETKIGENCTIHCGVKVVGTPGKDGAATIGDDVIIGANSVLIGPIKIGNGSIIGAGSIVTKDLPQHVVAVGNPARIIKTLDDPNNVVS